MNDTSFDLKDYLATQRARIEAALETAMPEAERQPALLHEAMRYAVLDGGKRLRPILCMAACKAVCGDDAPALFPGLAVEVLHAYTLVHDDLPCMDDDTMRRGKPTVHVVYGEADAVLTGDALQALAFEFAARGTAGARWPASQLVTVLAKAAGSVGVVGGQVEDLASIGSEDLDRIHWVHLHKTADLFRAAVCMGGVAANATPAEMTALEAYGKALGLAFQIADDLLDATPADGQEKSRAEADETTVLAARTPTEARALADAQVNAAMQALGALPTLNRAPLDRIAAYVVKRTY